MVYVPLSKKAIKPGELPHAKPATPTAPADSYKPLSASQSRLPDPSRPAGIPEIVPAGPMSKLPPKNQSILPPLRVPTVPAGPMSKRPLPGSTISTAESYRSPLVSIAEKVLPDSVYQSFKKDFAEPIAKARDFIFPSFSQQMETALEENPNATGAELLKRAQELDAQNGVIRGPDGMAIDPTAGVGSVRSRMADVVKEIAGETSSAVIRKLLKKEVPQISDDVIARLAQGFAKTENPNEIQKAINEAIQTVSKTPRAIANATPGVQVASDLPPLKKPEGIPPISKKTIKPTAVEKSPIDTIDDPDLGEVIDFIDDVRAGKEPTVDNAIAVRRLAERHNINPDLSDSLLANRFQDKIEATPSVRERVANRTPYVKKKDTDDLLNEVRDTLSEQKEGVRTMSLDVNDVLRKFDKDDFTGITKDSRIGLIEKSRFGGEGKDQIYATQSTADKAGVERWKKAIQSGERPVVTVDFSERTGVNRVIDGHHRLNAYSDLGFERIPVVDRGGRIIPESQTIEDFVRTPTKPVEKPQTEVSKTAETKHDTETVLPKTSKQVSTPEERAMKKQKADESKDDGTTLKPEEAKEKAQGVKEIIKDKDKVRDDLDKDRLALEFAKEALEQNPARALSKYAPKVGEWRGTLPEVIGPDAKTEFGRRGDDIITELGFTDTEEAREAFLQYRKQRDRYIEMEQAVKAKTKDFRDKEAVLKALRDEIRAEGEGRQNKINLVQEFFKFSDNEWNRLLKKLKYQDPRLWSEKGFDEFMAKLEVAGEELFRAVEKRMQLKTLIYEREFVKVENYFRAMGYPKLTDMSEKQLDEMIVALDKFKQGDEFLTVRQLETVKNTDISEIRTIREAKEKLAESRGVKVEDLDGVTYHPLDVYRYDSALADRNPLYEEMVLEKDRAFIEAMDNVIGIRNRLDELFTAARKSRKDTTLLDRFIPTDKKIFQWLESDALQKTKLAEEMTAEELAAGMYVRNLFEDARDYLVQHQVLKKYRREYITHIRRGFLEIWKDDGLLNAFKESFDAYKEELKFFDILNSDTQQILPMEKFFQYSLRRYGQLTPSQNVPRVVMAYFNAFERKKALDSIVPKLDIYAHALSPRIESERGLELDRNIKKFLKEWMNTKKGRPTDVRFVKPGDQIDWGLRTGIAFTRMLDLGFSIPTGIAAGFGEQSVSFVGLGAKNYLKGTGRLATPKGREFVKRYESFIGDSTAKKITESSGDIGKRFEAGMFALFTEATRTANMQWLLGSLTEQEWKSGIVSPSRLAQMRREMGRWRVVEGASSVLGSTSPGKVFTQYRAWAVPPMRTITHDIVTLRKQLKEKGMGAFKSREFQELLRSTLLVGTVVTSVGAYAHSLQDKEQKDLNFAQVILQKAYRDSLTLVGALDPELFVAPPRLMDFLWDLSVNFKDLVKLEEYESGDNKGELKGLVRLGRQFTPSAVRQLINTTTNESSNGPKKPSLPDRPNINPPKPPKPPKKPDFPKP